MADSPPVESDYPNQLAYANALQAYQAAQSAPTAQSTPKKSWLSDNGGPFDRAVQGLNQGGIPFGQYGGALGPQPGTDWRQGTAPSTMVLAPAPVAPPATPQQPGVIGRIEGLLKGEPDPAAPVATQSNPLKQQQALQQAPQPQAPLNNLIYALRRTNPATAYSRIPLPPGFKGLNWKSPNSCTDLVGFRSLTGRIPQNSR